MHPSDIAHLVMPSRAAAVADPRSGAPLLVGLTRPDLDADENVGHVVRLAAADGRWTTTDWTHGPHDGAPSISPDGRWVTFLRRIGGTGPDAHPQLVVMPMAGGEGRVVTALPLGAEAPVWSPDSTRIATTARIPEPGRYGTPTANGTAADASAEPPRHITRLDYRQDGVGFLRDRLRRLVVVDVAAALTGDPVDTAITDDTTAVSDPTWTPDGTALVVSAPRDAGAAETTESDLYRVDAVSGAITLLVESDGTAAAPQFGPDGTLFFLGTDRTQGIVAVPAGLYAARTTDDGPVRARRLTDHRTVDLEVGPGLLVPRSGDVLVGVLHRGAVELRAVPWTTDATASAADDDASTGAEPLPLDALPVLHGGEVVVRAITAIGEDVVIATVGLPDSAGEVVLIDTAAGSVETLSDLGAGLRAVGLRPVEELVGTAPDGHEVHGWLVLPEGEGPHPVLRVVHGGPFAQQDRAVFDEAQVYAAAGYAVVLGNPRGSAGYGFDHGQAIIGRLGTVDVDDVLALLDVALERDDLDASRVGIMGGSYGGFMTSWIAAREPERFTAAWSERAVNAWDSFAGSSDIGWFFAEAYVGADPEDQRRQSPLTYAADVTMPFMVAHSEQDWRCPLEQGQRQFVALRRAGVEAEFLLFPGEGHELSRSGRPSHRVQRFDHVLRWWNTHLPVV
ncbi:S9 family peptidase [Curtobacterium sp. MCBD17_019]|uniref:S9 family peptidase n=1 Tax=Curtobacterium sp. MCBD17_019 TaxID=2175669 RepID=UPI000DAA519B|nr:S9 family peptidase [Curtobacterium sp. MCBD17_019]PZE75379.1 S9 family peptidase [Curtobacterium sp. MCBD17_019]